MKFLVHTGIRFGLITKLIPGRVEIKNFLVITPLLWLILFVGQTALAANLALTGTATQISTYLPWSADLAIDGNTDGNLFNGSVTHTDTETDPWWEVDLGFEQEIESIIVWNRTDAAPERLADFILEVLDAGNSVCIPIRTAELQGAKR